jgi:hypothetical protein
MSNDPRESISAFLDGETVSPAELAQALSLPDSREMLVDFVLLRAGIRADESQPDQRLHHWVARGLKPKRVSLNRFFTPAPVIAAMGMAAVLLLVVWFGRPGPDLPVSIEQAPPSVNRVLQFERGVDWHNEG